MTPIRRSRTFVPLLLLAGLIGCNAGQVGDTEADDSALRSSSLQWSTHANRSAPQPVAGETLSGVGYLFLASGSSPRSVAFYLDDTDANGAPSRVEYSAPYDFAGTASSGDANPFDFSALTPGVHTLTLQVTSRRGRVSSTGVSFHVGSTDPADAGTPPQPDAGTPPKQDAGTPPKQDAGTVTPTAGCPAYPAFPDASCTGWKHTGVTLKAVPASATSGAGWHVENNTFYVTEAGAVIDSLDINLCVKILANNVTIKRSRIGCASYYLVNTSDPPIQYQGLVLTDVELDGLGNTAAQSIAVMGTENAHYTRLDVHGMASSGPRIASGTTVEDSYLHDFVCHPPDHSAGMSANDGGAHIVVRHNNIDINTTAAGCASAAWEIAKDFGTYNDVLTEQNLFNGGAYCAYAAVSVPGNAYPQATDIRFLDNVFGRKYTADCGLFGPIAEWSSAGASAWSGNTWGGGAAATAAHQTGAPLTP